MTGRSRWWWSSRRGRTAAVAAAVVLGLAGCQSGGPASGPTQVTIKALQLKFRVPAELADLTYVMARSGEGKPAANFSTKALTAAGGPGCAAGATGSVSPYPIGQIVLSPETPAKVAAEKKTNPEDVLGDFVKKLGTSYLYYSPPPPETCGDDRKVGDLQRRATKALRSALQTVEVAS